MDGPARLGNPMNEAGPQCIMKGRPASDGGSNLWGCDLVSLHCNRKTEGSGRVTRRECWAVPGGGGFAPHPQDLALWCLSR